MLVADLTDGSLQSHEEVLRVVNHIGMDPSTLPVEVSRIRGIFALRNRIIHELDVDLDHPRRKRRSHKRDTIVEMANDLLNLGDALLKHADSALKDDATELDGG